MTKIIFFLHHSNFIVSVSAAVLSFAVGQRLPFETRYVFALFLYCVVFSVYSLMRLYKLHQRGALSPSLQFYAQHKKTMVLLTSLHFVLALGAGIFLLQTTFDFLYFAFLFLLCVLYCIPIFKKPLREYPVLKQTILAFVWAMAIAGFSAFRSQDFPLENIAEGIIQVIGFFMFFAGISLPFEVKDVAIDNCSTLWEGLLLSRWLKVLSIFLVFNAWAILAWADNALWSHALWHIFFIALAVWLFFSDPSRGFLYYAFLDFFILLWGLVFLSL